jgi:hypothetical protein
VQSIANGTLVLQKQRVPAECNVRAKSHVQPVGHFPASPAFEYARLVKARDGKRKSGSTEWDDGKGWGKGRRNKRRQYNTKIRYIP